jgi:hypothetical protein
MEWHSTKNPPKEYGRRVIIFSPLYKTEVDQFRLIDSQFVKICKDATHWSYLKKPTKKQVLHRKSCTCMVNPIGYTKIVQLTIDKGCPYHKQYITKE